MDAQNKLEMRKFVIPECVFGVDARKLAGKYVRNLGAVKALVVTDPGVRAAGWADDVLESLRQLGLLYAVFDGLTPNPKAHEIMAGVEVYRTERCNCILAVGGGSPIDCAKGIGIVAANGGHILDYEGIDEVPSPIPPLVCVPTTAGSAADVSQFAIVTDTERRLKIAIVSKAIVSDVSLIDPVPLTSMPSDLAASTGLDTLTHAFEAYVSTAHSSLTDLFALEAIRLTMAHLANSIRDPMNLEVRSSVMTACTYAGFAFSNAGLGLVHAMAHSLGGLLDMAHGESNAMLLPHVVSFNFPSTPERYRNIAAAMEIGGAHANPQDTLPLLLEALWRTMGDLGAAETLGSHGVKRSDISDLAIKAHGDPDIATNPRKPSIEDIEDIYEKAL